MAAIMKLLFDENDRTLTLLFPANSKRNKSILFRNKGSQNKKNGLGQLNLYFPVGR